MKNLELLTKYSGKKPYFEPHCRPYDIKFVNLVKNKLPRGPILCAGCGIGDEYFGIRRDTKRQVLGIDINTEAIEFSRRDFTQGTFLEKDIHYTGFEDNRFAAVYMVNVAHYLDDRVQALEEIHRILKPGGFLYVHFNTKIVDDEGNVDYEESEEDIFDFIEKSKFEIVSTSRFKRTDKRPIKHEHTAIEYLLRKEPEGKKKLSDLAPWMMISLLATSPVVVPSSIEYFFASHALEQEISIEEYEKEHYSCDDEEDTKKRECKLARILSKPGRELAYWNHERKE